MNHSIELGDLSIDVRDDWVRHLGALCTIDIEDPRLVVLYRVNAEGEDFAVTLLEFGQKLGDGPELSCADWGKVFRM